MKLTRRTILGAATGLIMAGTMGAAQAADVTLRFGHLGAEDTAYQAGALKFQELVKELSDGSMAVEIFPNGVLGDEGEMFEQQMAGALDLSIVNPGKITDFSPSANIFTFPFLYKDVDHWNAVLSGDIGREIAGLIAGESGVQIVGYFGGGKRQVVSNRPLNSLDDLKDMKLRTNPTDPLIASWSALGARPTTFAWKEIYTGLQLGSIDGLLNEAEWIHRMRFHEVAPHIGLSEHDITVRLVTFSGATWDRLTETQRDVVLKAGAEASSHARNVQLAQDAEAMELLKNEGATLYPMDRAMMQEMVREPVLEVADRMGLADLYQRIQGSAGTN
ncbi:MAG: TRAP transporter substrate-binding protein [Pseudomonadota bacterium]